MNPRVSVPYIGSEPGTPFPPVEDALEFPNGLLAWGGDLQPARLLAAYEKGIFPWYSEGQPVLWWSPAPRCVIFPSDIRISRRTRRRYNSGRFQVTLDQAFAAVIQQCAAPRDDEAGTWITEEMQAAYVALHLQGHAHSVEVWQDACLAGGIYGLAIGAAFFGESMFSRKTDASKIALIALCQHLDECSYGLLDCQVSSQHLISMGAVELDREEFERRLLKLVSQKENSPAWAHGLRISKRW